MGRKVNVERLIQKYNEIRAKKESLVAPKKRGKKKRKKSEAQKKKELEKKKQKREELKKKRREEMAEITKKVKQQKAAKKRRKNLKNKKARILYDKNVRRVRERMRRANGDVYGLYNIMIMKNKKKISGKGHFRWMSSAYKRYNELIEENKKVIFPAIFTSKKNDTLGSVEYEIVLIKNIDANTESNEAVFKTDEGFVVKAITDDPNKVLLERHPWNIERKLIVYGFHPVYDKKTCPWVIENIILKDLSYENTKRIFMWNQYLIIENDYDFDFIQCKNSKETTLLYNTLFDLFSNVEYLFFMGVVNRMLVDKWRDKFREKTGWSEIKLSRDENI